MNIKNSRVLILDPDSGIRKIVKDVLFDIGFTHIEESLSVIDAIKKTMKFDINFIITEWNPESVTGLDLINEIKLDEKYKRIPFLVISSNAKKESILEAIQNNASGYILKPFSKSILTKKIIPILNKIKTVENKAKDPEEFRVIPEISNSISNSPEEDIDDILNMISNQKN